MKWLLWDFVKSDKGKERLKEKIWDFGEIKFFGVGY